MSGTVSVCFQYVTGAKNLLSRINAESEPNRLGEGMKMSGNNQENMKSGIQIMRDLFYGIKQKQTPTPELNESVKHRRPADTTKSVPVQKTPDRKIARPNPCKGDEEAV